MIKQKQSPWKTIFIFIGVLLVLYAIGTAIAFFINKKHSDNIEKKLNVINPSDISDKSLVDASVREKGTNHKISNFKLVNQNGDTITDAIVKNKIFVVEYFFTTCGSICPIMNRQMQRVQNKFQNSKDFIILSHTVWPEVDSVNLMKKYAVQHNANDTIWQFLTGSKEELYKMARKNYFVLKPSEVKGQGDGNGDFIHTNNFVLIDKNKRIRGYYDGTDSVEVNKMMVDIQNLMDGTAD